jgi:hypothetical protein
MHFGTFPLLSGTPTMIEDRLSGSGIKVRALKPGQTISGGVGESNALYAGFSSVTRRNRRELDTLERALSSSLEVNHVVLDYQQEIKLKPNTTDVNEGESELDQPLSWHLTRRQTGSRASSSISSTTQTSALPTTTSPTLSSATRRGLWPAALAPAEPMAASIRSTKSAARAQPNWP